MLQVLLKLEIKLLFTANLYFLMQFCYFTAILHFTAILYFLLLFCIDFPETKNFPFSSLLLLMKRKRGTYQGVGACLEEYGMLIQYVLCLNAILQYVYFHQNSLINQSVNQSGNQSINQSIIIVIRWVENINLIISAANVISKYDSL